MKNVIFLISVILFLSGCDKELDFEGFNRKPEIIVQSHFTPDSVIKVYLGLTVDIMQSALKNPPIGDAQVRIWDSMGNSFQLIHQGDGMYSANIFPVSGMEYRMEVLTSDGKIVSARDRIPKDTIAAVVDTLTGPVNRLDVKLTLNDPVTTENRYILRLMEFSTHYITNEKNEVTDSIQGWFPLSIVSSNNIFEISNTLSGNILNFELFEDEFFDGQTYQLNILINRELLQKSDLKSASSQLKVYLKSVNEPCYQYYLGIIKNSKNYGGPFSTNFNPEDNIENGHGIFSGYHFFEKVIALK